VASPSWLSRLEATAQTACVDYQLGAAAAAPWLRCNGDRAEMAAVPRTGPPHPPWAHSAEQCSAQRARMLATFGVACLRVSRPVLPIRSHREQRCESHALASIRLSSAGHHRRRPVPVGRARCSVESQVENEAHEQGTDPLPRRARRLKGLKLSSPRDVALAQVGCPRRQRCAALCHRQRRGSASLVLRGRGAA
jgi:hypothetical protein